MSFLAYQLFLYKFLQLLLDHLLAYCIFIHIPVLSFSAVLLLLLDGTAFSELIFFTAVVVAEDSCFC